MGTNRISLYKGSNQAEELRRMVRVGRQIIQQQQPKWEEARAAYRGETMFDRRGIHARDVSKTLIDRSGQRLRVNRLRQFTDGRVVQYAGNKPPFEVVPDSRDQTMLDRARLATRFLEAMWGESGWAVSRIARFVATAAEIDGFAYWSIIFDRAAKTPATIAFDAQGKPVTDRAQYEALAGQDPDGGQLLNEQQVPMGEVTFRYVRPGALAVDPLAVENPEDADWIIESMVRARADVESEFGINIDDMAKVSSNTSSTSSVIGGSVRNKDVITDLGDDILLRERDAVIVHKMFARPCARWPQGAHVEWLDLYPDQPLMEEPWQWRLPYFCFVPKPGPGHFIRSRATVADEHPVQLLFDRWTLAFSRYMDKVGNPPWAMPKGALVGDSIYNSKGYFEWHPALGEPKQVNIPSEPTQVLANGLGWLIDQMGEIANLPPVARGLPPGSGVEAAVALRDLGQNQEQQMIGTAAQFTAWLEKSISWALELVSRYYTIPRMVLAPGVDDSGEFAAFTGEMIKGCTRFRVTGSVMPKQRAAQLQTAMAMLPVLGERALPLFGSFVDANMDDVIQHLDADKEKQKRETRDIVALGSFPGIDRVWQEFQQDITVYGQALQKASESAPLTHPELGTPMPAPDPKQVLAQEGIHPPNLTQRFRDLGLEVPIPEDFDIAAIHIATLDDSRKAEAYDHYHPAIKQLLREHKDGHERFQGLQLAAAAERATSVAPMAGGSPPAEKGQASPPRERAASGGQFGQPQPLGGTT